MEHEALKQEIDALIAVLGDETVVAKPAAERAVLEKIRLILDRTRDQRTSSSRDIWEYYLPYAANLCLQVSKYEAGREDDLEYFASENSQFWLDSANAFLERSEISRVIDTFGKILESTRMMKQDWIARVDILLQALAIALEISDKKHSILLYEEAEK